jgi:hypothetical protein
MHYWIFFNEKTIDWHQIYSTKNLGRMLYNSFYEMWREKSNNCLKSVSNKNTFHGPYVSQ